LSWKPVRGFIGAVAVRAEARHEVDPSRAYRRGCRKAPLRRMDAARVTAVAGLDAAIKPTLHYQALQPAAWLLA
jgi:hypothetical protein